MKLQFQALSITLGLVALLGTCMSAKSGTPDVNSVDSHVENSAEVVPNEIQLGDAEDAEDAKVQAAEEIQDAKVKVSEDTEAQATEEIPDTEDAEAQATEEIKDAEAGEIKTPELETVQESKSVEESRSTEETLDNKVETVKKDGVEDIKSKF